MMSNPFKRLLFHHENGISLVKTKPPKRTANISPGKADTHKKTSLTFYFKLQEHKFITFILGNVTTECLGFPMNPFATATTSTSNQPALYCFGRVDCNSARHRLFVRFLIFKNNARRVLLFFFSRFLSNLMVFWNNKSNPRLKD